MVLGQYRAVIVGTWWYWVIKGQYWTVLGFILESLIVGRFVVFRWGICRLLVDFNFIVGRFVVVLFISLGQFY